MDSLNESEEKRLLWWIDPTITQRGQDKPVLRLMFRPPFQDVSNMPKELSGLVFILYIS